MKRIALLLPFLVLGATTRAEFRLQDLLPETTLLFAETPSADKFRKAFQKTPLFKFFEDEEIRPFADEALKNFGEFFAGFEKELGIPWDKAWELPTGQIALAMPTIAQDNDFQPDFVLTLDCAGRRDTLLKAAAFARKTYETQSGKKAEIWKVGEDEVVTWLIGANVRWHLAVLGDTLVAATWKGTMEQVAAAFRKGCAKPLSASATYKKAVEKAAAKELFLYADVAGFVKAARERLGENERKFIGALGLDGFTTAAGGLAIGEHSVSERFFLGTSGERKGLAKFLSLKGAAPGFEVAPEEAIQFFSLSIDLAELYDTFLEIVRSADEFQQQQLVDEIASFEKQVGISLKNDLFPAFGPRIYSYAALPPDGLVPDGIACFEIKDGARFDKCLQAVLTNIPAELGEIDFKGKKIWHFKFQQPGGLDPGRMFLSMLYWISEGDKLFVSGLVPLSGGYGAANALKRHLLREGKPKLTSVPAVRDWLGGETGGVPLVLYLDLGRVFTVMYNTLAPVAPFFRTPIRSAGGLDPMKMPLGETVGKYLGQTIHRVVVEPDGLRSDAISASGTTLMTIVCAGAAGVALFPAIARASAETNLSQCRAQASEVYSAVVSHHEEKNIHPEKTGAGFFDQLKELGYLEQNPLCSGTGRYRGPAKDMNGLGDTDVIFCDEPENHPDGSIMVLRKNGAMETLRRDHADYKKALETTRGE